MVLTTSSAGLYGFRAEAAYSAAKAAVAMLARVGADELGRYGATVNAVAPVARTRLTEWLGEAPASPGASREDPLAAEHVAPVIAWLLGPAARTVTGRVLEAENGQISAPSTWQPGPQFPLPSLMSPEVADVLLPRVLASAAPPPRCSAPSPEGREPDLILPGTEQAPPSVRSNDFDDPERAVVLRPEPAASPHLVGECLPGADGEGQQRAVGCLLSRTATAGPTAATSTQVPPLLPL